MATDITCTPQLELHYDEAQHSHPYGSPDGWQVHAILHPPMVQFLHVHIVIAIAIAIAITIDFTLSLACCLQLARYKH